MPVFPLLLPRPRAVRATDLAVDLRKGVAVRVPEPWLAGPLGRRLRESIDRLTASVPGLLPRLNPAEDAAPLLAFEVDPSRPAEGFRLTLCDHGCRLAAATAAGAWYGWLAFEQALEQGSGVLPVCEIDDEPAFAARGVMLDISRCKVPTQETLRFLVARLSRLRINQLQLYTEHTFAYAGHETVWRDASPMTAAEIRELDDFCADHFIELVPNQNSFGHFERWLRHPEYKPFAESPDGFTSPWGTVFPHGSVLRPNEESLRLIEGLYDQLLPNFRSRLINVGCDETYELGEGWSRAQCEARGRHRVYLDFLVALHERVSARGFRMQFWGDIILKQPELIRELPPGVTALEWGYEHDHPFAEDCEKFRASGVPFYVCPGTSSWNSLIGKNTNALDNLRAAALHGRAAGAAGYLVTDWGDNGHHQPLPMSFLPFAAAACLAWSPGGIRDEEAEAAAAWAFLDGCTETARAFAALGRVSDVISERFYNSTIFHQALFHPELVPAKLDERFARVPAAELHTADDLLAALASSASAISDALLRAEFLHAIDMARAGIARRLARMDGLAAPLGFDSTLDRLRDQHRSVWLARNRPGGLHESIGKFDQVRIQKP